jgi:hypothetical protein
MFGVNAATSAAEGPRKEPPMQKLVAHAVASALYAMAYNAIVRSLR